MEVDSDEEYLSKHYEEPKKPEYRVKFKEDKDLVQEKFITAERTFESTIEKERIQIQSFTSKEEIDKRADELLQKSKQLYDRKKDLGYDISYELDNLKKQLEYLEEQKLKLEKTKQEKVEPKNEPPKNTIPVNLEVRNRSRSPNNRKEAVNKNAGDVLKERKTCSKIYEHLEKSILTRAIEVLLLFHDVYMSNKSMLEIIFQVKQVFSRDHNAILNLSVGSYKSNFFTVNKFQNIQEFSCKQADIMNLRKEILNLEWSEKSIKMVINILNKQITNEKYRNFLYHQDEVKTFLDYREIKLETVIYQNNSKIEYIIFQSIYNFKISIYLQKIYFLRRFNFSSYEDYTKTICEKRFDRDYKVLDLKKKNKYIVTYYGIDWPKRTSKIINSECLEIKSTGDTVSQKNGLFVLPIQVNYNNFRHHLGYLEIYSNRDAMKNVIDMHSMAEHIIKKFNTSRTTKLTFMMADIFMLEHESFNILGCKNIKNSPKIERPCSSVQEMIDCLSHFSFEFFQIILTDLRPISIEKYKVLVTEPVIFSESNGFNSSNLGSDGINRFFADHVCSNYCRDLKLSVLKIK